MKTSKLFAVALSFGLLGGAGLAIAAEPPEITVADFDGLPGSNYETIKVNDTFFTYSTFFTSNVNSNGDLFLIQAFSILSPGRQLSSFRQIDCSDLRERSLFARLTSEAGTSDINEPTQWSPFYEGSVMHKSCIQAYNDRAQLLRRSAGAK